MAGPEIAKQYVPLTCHGHSRPVTHLSFSSIVPGEESYYLISACKDNNPMLRDGITGDWIGTFFKHKGAVWQARLSSDAATAATASGDFTARVWDTHSGEEIYNIQHKHIVRAIAFPPFSGSLLATGGFEKKLRIFDLESLRNHPDTNPTTTEPNSFSADRGLELGAGVHQGAIKAIVWTQDPNVLVTAADDKKIRWWDLRTQTVVQEQSFQGEIGTCEFSNVKPEPNDIGGGHPVLTIAAGKSVYFFGGPNARTPLKTIHFDYEVASAALHPSQRKFVTGGRLQKDTWAKVYNYDTEEEIDIHKGHHGPIWSISFSPDGKLYATGSEDGTIKMWKNCEGPYGLWRNDRE